MQPNVGKLILRLMIGGMMIFHGIAKLSHGIDFIKVCFCKMVFQG